MISEKQWLRPTFDSVKKEYNVLDKQLNELKGLFNSIKQQAQMKGLTKSKKI